jgi:hypothetical protein
VPAALFGDVPAPEVAAVSASLVRSEYTASSAPQTTTTSPTSGHNRRRRRARRSSTPRFRDRSAIGREGSYAVGGSMVVESITRLPSNLCERADTDLPRDGHTLKSDWALPLVSCVGHLSGT